ncbi:unnamed protein product [Rotaria magnacalcarata]|uniref:Uncharacterized protein n=1 Tax=Rotaria magnacalcarata TaxID=392030 RepID=A0A8S3FJ96_9BILA|nr:unnamed protein product [Rotaria magnacalcarata]
MAKFDLSIGGNRSEVMYFRNSTLFICTWKNLYLKNQEHIGAFTFQAILQNTGNIYFNYINIPSMILRNLNVSTNIGLSNANVSEDSMRQHKNGPPIVVLYDKLNLDKEKIKNGVTVILTMYNRNPRKRNNLENLVFFSCTFGRSSLESENKSKV